MRMTAVNVVLAADGWYIKATARYGKRSSLGERCRWRVVCGKFKTRSEENLELAKKGLGRYSKLMRGGQGRAAGAVKHLFGWIGWLCVEVLVVFEGREVVC